MAKYAWNREALKRVPKKAGVYVIEGTLGSRPGQSKDLNRRRKEHFRQGVPGVLWPLSVRITKEPHPVRRRRLERRKGGR